MRAETIAKAFHENSHTGEADRVEASGDDLAQHGEPLRESRSIAGWAKELHETGGTVGHFLIARHAAAALFHHYVVRDNTLRRMLPSRD